MGKKADKLTVLELMKQKEKYQVKKDVKEELYIERLEATITIQKPSNSLIVETMKMANDPNQSEHADKYLAYNIVVEPNLKDTELHTVYDCVEPMDIVSELFEYFEIGSISQKGMELAGFGKDVGLVDEVKN
jgi:hypothetical protein